MNEYYRKTLEKVEGVLKWALPEENLSVWADWIAGCPPEPVPRESFAVINRPALDLLSRGGKRWRPVLMCLSCELYGGGEAAVSFTPLVEFPHNGSLIVDDIEDNSDMRRGLPAVHTLYGQDTAINTGNFLYFLPLILLENPLVEDEIRLRMYGYYGEALRRLHLGQGLDIQWHRDQDFFPEKGAYLQMCRFKTGSLARLAGQAGAAAAGVPEEEAEFLGGLWETLGVAFQIADDVTNLTRGNPGKNRGDDIVEGKKSLPVLLAAAASPDNRKRLGEIFRLTRERGFEEGRPLIEEAIALLEGAGAVEAARQEALASLARVESEVKSRFSPSEPREAVLSMIASFQGS